MGEGWVSPLRFLGGSLARKYADGFQGDFMATAIRLKKNDTRNTDYSIVCAVLSLVRMPS